MKDPSPPMASCSQVVLYMALYGAVLVAVLYLVAAGIAFRFLNPKANDTVFWTHIGQTLLFERIPEYQE